MKLTNDRVAHNASVLCGFTAAFGMNLFQLFLIMPSILRGGFRFVDFVSLVIGFLLFFSGGYLVCRFLLVFLHPIYLRVSTTLSIIIFALVGAAVSIVPLLLMNTVYRSALDIPISLDLKSIVGHILFGLFGSCCAASAWYVLKKYEPNKALQQTSR
jgi:hypothetical protein